MNNNDKSSDKCATCGLTDESYFWGLSDGSIICRSCFKNEIERCIADFKSLNSENFLYQYVLNNSSEDLYKIFTNEIKNNRETLKKRKGIYILNTNKIKIKSNVWFQDDSVSKIDTIYETILFRLKLLKTDIEKKIEQDERDKNFEDIENSLFNNKNKNI